jgi:hypothetical protein
MTKLQKFNTIHYIHFWHLPEGTEEYHKNHRTDGVLAKIRTKHFPNTSQERYTNLLSNRSATVRCMLLKCDM